MASRNVRLGENPQVYFNVPLADFSGPALNEAGGQPQVSLNGAAYDNTGIGILVAVGFGEYYAVLDSSVVLVVGDRILTRYKGAATAEVDGDDFTVVSGDGTLPADPLSITSYGSVANADLYFSFALNTRKWDTASPVNKRKALIEATRIIDSLNYAGKKASAGQVLQFPRQNVYVDPLTDDSEITTDDRVPADIKIATYIVALRLLEGYDPDKQADLLGISSTKFGQVGTVYARDYIPEHMRAGIPSDRAWKLIRPYLRDPYEVILQRI
jgi:hypothetical protein